MSDIQKDDLVGKTKAIRDHDHDMIHDLSKRLDAAVTGVTGAGSKGIHYARSLTPLTPACLAQWAQQ